MSTNERTPAADFDRLASAWLADGPAELADRVLDDALREVHLTHQRRRVAALWSGPFGSRRFLPMNVLAKTLLGLAAALVVAVGGITLLTGGPNSGALGPSPSPLATPRQVGSPMPPPYLDATFTSPLYHYVVHYPSTWRVTPATRMWTRTINSSGDHPYWGDAALDTLQGSDVRLIAWAQPIPQAQGVSQAQAAALWVRNLGIGSLPCVADSELPPTFAVAQGQGQGYTIINGCGFSAPVSLVKDGVIYEVAMVLNGVGWDFTFDGHVDAPYVRDVLLAVSLPPAGLSTEPSPAPAASGGG